MKNEENVYDLISEIFADKADYPRSLQEAYETLWQVHGISGVSARAIIELASAQGIDYWHTDDLDETHLAPGFYPATTGDDDDDEPARTLQNAKKLNEDTSRVETAKYDRREHAPVQQNTDATKRPTHQETEGILRAAIREQTRLADALIELRDELVKKDAEIARLRLLVGEDDES